MLKKCNLWHRWFAFEVNSWRYLWNAADAVFRLFLSSTFFCSSKVNFCPRCRALSLVARTSLLMLSIVTSFFFTFTWLLIFVLLWCIPKPTDSVLLLKSHNISSNLFSCVDNSSTPSAKRKFVRQVVFLVAQSNAFFVTPAFASDLPPERIVVLYYTADSTEDSPVSCLF